MASHPPHEGTCFDAKRLKRRAWVAAVVAALGAACSDDRGPREASVPRVRLDSGSLADAGPEDLGLADASELLDAAPLDAGFVDASSDASLPDAAPPDSSAADAVAPDATLPDAARLDASIPDAGPSIGTSVACREAHGDYFADVLVNSAGTTLVGYTREYYGSHAPNQALIVRRSAAGAILWQKRLGGSGEDGFVKVLEGTGDTVVAFGNTASHTNGSQEVWAVWFDASGQVSRELIYPGTDWDELYGARRTADGGYLLAGYSGSFGALAYDGWLMKLDSAGQVVWQKSYGEASYSQDRFFDVVELPDGYVIAGRTSSFGVVYEDLWVLRVDLQGVVSWQNRYHVGVDDRIYAALPAPNGVYLAGYTADKLWALKLDLTGAVVWSKLIDNTSAELDVAFSASPATNGFVTAGYSFFTHIFGNPPSHDYDFFLVRIDDSGQVVWDRAFGGEEAEWATGIARRPSGGWTVTGWTESFAGVSLEPGSWVLDVEPDGSVPGRCGTEAAHATTLEVTDAPVTIVPTPGIATITTAAATAVSSPELPAAVSCMPTSCAQ
ncbi:MAG: hypothetical protein HYV07_02455 [Deltaproteobacteria bacterium]|nr:hypothetical protein [Deltaproteobacteria bacterium]